MDLLKKRCMTEEIGKGKSAVATPSRIWSSRKKNRKCQNIVELSLEENQENMLTLLVITIIFKFILKLCFPPTISL